MADRLAEIVSIVQKRSGYRFAMSEVFDIISSTVRKAELNGEDESYIPILFENELEDHIMRASINSVWREEKCVAFV